VNSQHADPEALTVRPGATVKSAASKALSDRDLEMRAFIVACQVALAADPDGFLATLAPHWPPPKPRGRPRGERRRAAPEVRPEH
jgi:hypothetical protein